MVEPSHKMKTTRSKPKVKQPARAAKATGTVTVDTSVAPPDQGLSAKLEESMKRLADIARRPLDPIAVLGALLEILPSEREGTVAPEKNPSVRKSGSNERTKS